MNIIGINDLETKLGQNQLKIRRDAIVLVELPPGPRTISWWSPTNEDQANRDQSFIMNVPEKNQLNFKHIHFPWTYYRFRLHSVENPKSQKEWFLFLIHDFRVYTSQEKLQNNNGEYLLTGSEINFPNVINTGRSYEPCFGNDFQYPIHQNLYDSLKTYLDGFLQIPFDDGSISEEESITQYYEFSNLESLPVGRGTTFFQFSNCQESLNDLAKTIYPRIA